MTAHCCRLVFFLLLVAPQTFSQKLKKQDRVVYENLQNHIRYLADDKLEGRRAGTPGETLAMNYISAQFENIGLQPAGTDHFLQAFDIHEGKKISNGTLFSINGKNLEPGVDYFPFPYCPNMSLEALPAISVQEADMPWFINLKDVLEDNADNPHFDLANYVHQQGLDLKKKGASALIFYNTSGKDDELKFDAMDKSDPVKIPVIYVKPLAAKKYFSDPSSSINVKIRIDVVEGKRIGHNVIGYINNGATNTVVLGAHFDHLGYGEDGNSMLRTGEKLIHNGADDNASGTAALIELARMLQHSKLKNNNYLFIAFSGEELGLFGSKYFVENPTIRLSTVNYMINMDMVGRLSDSSHVLTIGGYGTSPTWGSLVKIDDKKSGFVIRTDSSGTGPSDHTSFYRKDIPVLFFFTGLHKDYHRPTDDFEKINFMGELAIVNYIYTLITKENKEKDKLVFTKTRETQSGSSARFSVTMGIMPDYTFAGTGVRVDGISDGRTAQKAGLQTGDIILQLGDFSTASLESYMQALGKFKKGDATTVTFKRGNDTLKKQVQF
jgi:hypothetical protein